MTGGPRDLTAVNELLNLILDNSFGNILSPMVRAKLSMSTKNPFRRWEYHENVFCA